MADLAGELDLLLETTYGTPAFPMAPVTPSGPSSKRGSKNSFSNQPAATKGDKTITRDKLGSNLDRIIGSSILTVGALCSKYVATYGRPLKMDLDATYPRTESNVHDHLKGVFGSKWSVVGHGTDAIVKNVKIHGKSKALTKAQQAQLDSGAGPGSGSRLGSEPAIPSSAKGKTPAKDGPSGAASLKELKIRVDEIIGTSSLGLDELGDKYMAKHGTKLRGDLKALVKDGTGFVNRMKRAYPGVYLFTRGQGALQITLLSAAKAAAAAVKVEAPAAKPVSADKKGVALEELKRRIRVLLTEEEEPVLLSTLGTMYRERFGSKLSEDMVTLVPSGASMVARLGTVFNDELVRSGQGARISVTLAGIAGEGVQAAAQPPPPPVASGGTQTAPKPTWSAVADLTVSTTTKVPLTINVDLDTLKSALPTAAVEWLDSSVGWTEVSDLVLDAKAPLTAYKGEEGMRNSDLVMTPEDLSQLTNACVPAAQAGQGTFINGSLHSVSLLRHGDNVVGATVRVAREVVGLGSVLLNMVAPNASVLVVGRPGSGKTTLLRDLARSLSTNDSGRVVVVDSNADIAGGDDYPIGIGAARRLSVPSASEQAPAMRESSKSHHARTVIVDELESETDVLETVSLRRRGVQVLACITAATIRDVIRRDELRGLLKKHVFDTVVEVVNPFMWRVYSDIHEIARGHVPETWISSQTVEFSPVPKKEEPASIPEAPVESVPEFVPAATTEEPAKELEEKEDAPVPAEPEKPHPPEEADKPAEEVEDKETEETTPAPAPAAAVADATPAADDAAASAADDDDKNKEETSDPEKAAGDEEGEEEEDEQEEQDHLDDGDDDDDDDGEDDGEEEQDSDDHGASTEAVFDNPNTVLFAVKVTRSRTRLA